MNITNGLYLNKYLQNKYPNDVFIPFNEAIVEGNPSLPIFSNVFWKERCETHQVNEIDYKENMQEFIEFTKHLHEYSSITLWFGKDMFCQLNLLTILAYFNQENYMNPIHLNLIDEDSYEIIEQITVPKEDYLFVYEKVFIEQQSINCKFTELNQAIHDYLNYTNEMIPFIKNNSHYCTDELIHLLLDKTKKYGLGDTQIHKLIQKYKIN